MRGINKVILLGNVGKDPELRHTQDGRAVANFSMATSRVFLDRGGERREETEWHKVVSFGRLAEICSEYLKKGRPVYLEGRIQTRQWTDKEGNTRTTTEVLADTLQLLGRNQERNDARSPSTPIYTEEAAVPF